MKGNTNGLFKKSQPTSITLIAFLIVVSFQSEGEKNNIQPNQPESKESNASETFHREIAMIQGRYAQECKKFDLKNFLYNKSSIIERTEELQNYLRWVRIPLGKEIEEVVGSKTPQNSLRLTHVFSVAGLILYNIAGSLALISIMFAFKAILFFYAPSSFQRICELVNPCKNSKTAKMGQKYPKNSENERLQMRGTARPSKTLKMTQSQKSGKSYQDYPFFEQIYQWRLQRGSAISQDCLLKAKFVAAGVSAGCLAIALIQYYASSQSTDCALVDASLNAAHPRTGSYFMEMGGFSEDNLLNKFSAELENFENLKFVAEYEEVLGKGLAKKVESLQRAFGELEREIKSAKIFSCRNDHFEPFTHSESEGVRRGVAEDHPGKIKGKPNSEKNPKTGDMNKVKGSAESRLKDKRSSDFKQGKQFSPYFNTVLKSSFTSHISKEVQSFSRIAEGVHKSSLLLKKTHSQTPKTKGFMSQPKPPELVKKFKKATKKVSKKVDQIAKDLFLAQHQLIKYLNAYNLNLTTLANLSLTFLVFLIFHLIPASKLNGFKLRKPIRLLCILTGTSLIFYCSASLFYSNQARIQACLLGSKALNQNHELLGRFISSVAGEDYERAKWITECFSDDKGKGDLLEVLSFEEDENFLDGFGILKGLSYNLTTEVFGVLRDGESRGLVKLGVELERLQGWKLDPFYGARTQGFTHKDSYGFAMSKLRRLVGCPQLEFQVLEQNCRGNGSRENSKSGQPGGEGGSIRSNKGESGARVEFVTIDEFVEKNSPREFAETCENESEKIRGAEPITSKKSTKICVNLSNLNSQSSERLLKFLEEALPLRKKQPKKSNISLKNLILGLSNCISSHRNYSERLNKQFNNALTHFRILSKSLSQTEEPYNRLRGYFKRSLIEYQEAGHSIDQMTSCRTLKNTTYSILGNLCFGRLGRHNQSDSQILSRLGGTNSLDYGAWFWYWLAGMGLIVVAVVNFLEVFLDKTSVRKWRVLSGADEDDVRIEYENELGAF